ncbi:MAG: cell division protein FtsH, partial [Pseudomonadota bacterium]
YTSKLAMAMGGKVAEEIKFGEENVTSGASSDIQQVTRIARAMVTQFGMSEKLGNIDYADQRESFLGAYGGGASVSSDTQRMIEEEVKRLVDDAYETATRVLTEHNDEFENLAQGLLEYETLTGDEITRVARGEKLDRSDDGGTPPTPPEQKKGRSAIPKAGKPKLGGLGGDTGPAPDPA